MLVCLSSLHFSADPLGPLLNHPILAYSEVIGDTFRRIGNRFTHYLDQNFIYFCNLLWESILYS